MPRKDKHVFKGDRMREQRERRGLTQYELGKLIGGSQHQVARYEIGERIPQSDTLAKIAMALGCSADYLLGLVDTPNQYMPSLSSDELALLEAAKKGLDIDALLSLVAFLKGSDK